MTPVIMKISYGLDRARHPVYKKPHLQQNARGRTQNDSSQAESRGQKVLSSFRQCRSAFKNKWTKAHIIDNQLTDVKGQPRSLPDEFRKAGPEVTLPTHRKANEQKGSNDSGPKQFDESTATCAIDKKPISGEDVESGEQMSRGSAVSSDSSIYTKDVSPITAQTTPMSKVTAEKTLEVLNKGKACQPPASPSSSPSSFTMNSDEGGVPICVEDEVLSETVLSSSSSPNLEKAAKALMAQVLIAMLQKLGENEDADLAMKASAPNAEDQERIARLEAELKIAQLQLRVAQMQSDNAVNTELSRQQQVEHLKLQLQNGILQLQASQSQRVDIQAQNLALEQKLQEADKALENANQRSDLVMQNKDSLLETMQAQLNTKEQELQALQDLRDQEIVPGTLQDLKRLESELLAERKLTTDGQELFKVQQLGKEELEMQVNAAQLIMDDLFSQKADFVAKISDLETMCAACESDATLHKKELHDEMQEVALLQASLAESISTNANLHQMCFALQQESQNSQSQQGNDQLQQENAQLRSALEATNQESNGRVRQIRELQATLRRFQHQISLVEVEPSVLDSACEQAEQPYHGDSSTGVDQASQDRTAFTFETTLPSTTHTTTPYPPQPAYWTAAPSQLGRDFYTEAEYHPPQPKRPPPPPPIFQGIQQVNKSPEIPKNERPTGRPRGRL